MKVAAVQMKAVFEDVEANLIKVENFTKQAADRGAELVLFPEFFTSAIGFEPQMLDVAAKDCRVLELLQRLSNKYNVIIGGSYLWFDNGNVYNAFKLVFPNGEVFIHKKDIPTQFENCYYTKGDTEHILYTPIGDIGVALCWEMLRYDTIRRLSGKADLILAGSCWWDLPDDAPAEREQLRQYNQRLALQTPVVFAELMHVPVVHANHCGKITAYRFPGSDKLQTRQLVGAAQIVDAEGNIIARRPFSENEGMIIEDLDLKKSDRRKADMDDKRYWIPDLPESYIKAWEQLNPQGTQYYQNTALPYYKKHITSIK